MTSLAPDAATLELLRTVAIEVAGLGLLAGVVGLLVSFAVRYRTTRPAPKGAAVLFGLGVIASWLLADLFVTGGLVEDASLLSDSSAGALLSVLFVGAVTATVGGRLGDSMACELCDITPISDAGGAETAVRDARLSIELTLPERVESPAGYQPIDPAVEEELAGRTMRVPHGLDPAARRRRLERRIERDFDVEYVSVELDDAGAVERLVAGTRPSGLGTTLPPNTIAIAVRGDPSPRASPGDPVELWSVDETPRLVVSGVLRAVNDDVVTIVIDEEHADAVDQSRRYRVVTRPDAPTDAYAFAARLAVADETVTALTVESGDRYDGEFVGWLPGRVLVLERDGEQIAFPADSETLRAGDELWVLGTPATLSDVSSYDPDAERDAVDESETPASAGSDAESDPVEAAR